MTARTGARTTLRILACSTRNTRALGRGALLRRNLNGPTIGHIVGARTAAPDRCNRMVDCIREEFRAGAAVLRDREPSRGARRIALPHPRLAAGGANPRGACRGRR